MPSFLCSVVYMGSVRALGFRYIDSRRWCQLRSIHESFRLPYRWELWRSIRVESTPLTPTPDSKDDDFQTQIVDHEKKTAIHKDTSQKASKQDGYSDWENNLKLETEDTRARTESWAKIAEGVLTFVRHIIQQPFTVLTSRCWSGQSFLRRLGYIPPPQLSVATGGSNWYHQPTAYCQQSAAYPNIRVPTVIVTAVVSCRRLGFFLPTPRFCRARELCVAD